MTARRRGRGGAAWVLATAAFLAAALTAGAITNFATASADSTDTVSPVSDATFTWGLNQTASAGAYFGGCNFLSAGAAGNTGSSQVWTASTPAPGYTAQAGNVTILKPNTAGQYAQPSWANKCTGPDGVTALTTATSSRSEVRITGGVGTVDPVSGTADILWSGSFTSVFYGGLVYWTATNPELKITAGGTGTVTATLSGYAASMEDSTLWRPLSPTSVTLATLSDVAVTDAGITVTPDYRGVRVTAAAGSSAQVVDPGTSPDWGSFPQSFIDFQNQTGESSYWYSSGLNDGDKVAAPLAVGYSGVTSGPTPPPSSSGTPTTPGASGTPSATPSHTPTTTPSATPSQTPSRTPSATPTRTSSPSAQSCVLSDGVRGGYLVWGFKSSFRRYVGGGFPANTITASGGASILNGDLAIAGQPGTGTYSWPFRSSSSYTSTSAFSVQYGGSVGFSYPAHFFDITIANPKVVVAGSSGTLLADLTVTVAEPGKAPTTTAKKAEKLATIELSGTSPVIDDTGVTRLLHTAIADASAFSFDGTDFYTPGQALDDATVFLAGCASAPSKPASGDVPPSSDGSSDGGGGEVLTPSGSDDPAASGSGGIIPTTRFRPTPSAGAAARPGLSIPAEHPGADRAAPTAAATPIVPLIAAAAVLLAGLLAFLLLRRRAARLRAAATATTGGAP